MLGITTYVLREVKEKMQDCCHSKKEIDSSIFEDGFIYLEITTDALIIAFLFIVLISPAAVEVTVTLTPT